MHDNELETCRPRRTHQHRERPTVVTVVEADTRRRINLATDGVFTTVHTSSVAEAMEAVRNPSVRALLLSPNMLDEHRIPEVRRLIMEGAGVATAAVLNRGDDVSNDRLLALGSCGVNQVLDLSTRAGLRHLRTVGCEYGRATGRRILVVLNAALADAASASRGFFHQLVLLAPKVTNTKSLARELGINPSTITSRFHRHRLPSVKTYLAEMRVLYAVAYFENPELSIAEVARYLEFSSPQSFGRHVRVQYRMHATNLRREYSFDRMMDRFLRDFIIPYWKTLTTFEPFES